MTSCERMVSTCNIHQIVPGLLHMDLPQPLEVQGVVSRAAPLLNRLRAAVRRHIPDSPESLGHIQPHTEHAAAAVRSPSERAGC